MIKAYYLCVMILKFINIRSLLGRSSKRRLVNTVLGVAMNESNPCFRITVTPKCDLWNP